MRFVLPLIAAGVLAAEEAPFLHPLFTDHAVLQRGKPLPVWGWSAPGDRVTVTLGQQTVQAVTGTDGRWEALFDPLPPAGSLTLTAQGAKSATASDLLVGDVWLCSGQSNMEWTMSGIRDAEKERLAADFPRIRQFSGTKRFSLTPQAITGGGWAVCSPQTVANFTAVGYCFGRELHQSLDVPIGLVNASWGGTRIEAWASRAAWENFDHCRDDLAQLTGQLAGTGRTFAEAMTAWWALADPAPGAQQPAFDDQAWTPSQLPGYWEKNGLPEFDGVVWYRRTVDIPAELAGKDAKLKLGPIDDQDVTWVDGTVVGHTESWNHPRIYAVPAGLLAAGTHTLAIRVLDTGGNGGLHGKPEDLQLEIGGRSLPLAGTWKRINGKPLATLPKLPVDLNNPNVITSLSNGMIEPLAPMALSGVIWYQGEANATEGNPYDRTLPALIADWRTRFAAPDLPFGIVQLANFMDAVPEPVQDAGWPWLRETQLLTSLTVPRTGLAVTIDIGETKDIHPRNKQEVGHRLATWALHDVYGRADRARSGPVYAGMTVTGAEIRVAFRDTEGGLVAKGELAGFAIAGAQGSWVKAQARIDGDAVVLSSPEVPQPTRVRYAWANNPAVSLYNGAGLPASPFRSDGPVTAATAR